MRDDDLARLKEQHAALSRAMSVRIAERGLPLSARRRHGILNAFKGLYRFSPMVSPEYFGFTKEEFSALRALIYGNNNPTR